MRNISHPKKNSVRYAHKVLTKSTRHSGTALAQCIRRCATNQKVAGSIPAGVIGIFH